MIFTHLLDTTKPTKLSVGPQNKIHVGSVCHGQRACNLNLDMTHSPKCPGGGDGRRQKWDGCPVQQDGCSFLTWHRRNYPCHVGSEQTGTLPHVDSGAGPWPKRHAWSWATAEHHSQPPAPEAHTPDAAGGNKGQMCELDA